MKGRRATKNSKKKQLGVQNGTINKEKEKETPADAMKPCAIILSDCMSVEKEQSVGQQLKSPPTRNGKRKVRNAKNQPRLPESDGEESIIFCYEKVTVNAPALKDSLVPVMKDEEQLVVAEKRSISPEKATDNPGEGYKCYPVKGESSCLVLLYPGSSLPFSGVCEFCPVFGTVEVFGYECSPEPDLHASKTQRWRLCSSTDVSVALSFSCPNQKTPSAGKMMTPEELKEAVSHFGDIQHTTILSSYTNGSSCFALRPASSALLRTMEAFSLETEAPTNTLVKQLAVNAYAVIQQGLDKWSLRAWRPTKEHLDFTDQLIQSACRKIGRFKKHFIVVVAGAKGVGKSTFGRYLINKALNRYLDVVHVECDVGQTEFTPPGCISLTKVSQPLFSPPFLHLQQPERCIFFGEVSPENRPKRYISDIKHLTTELNNIPPAFVVVNTNGWITNAGAELLGEVCDLFAMDSLVYLDSAQFTEELPKVFTKYRQNFTSLPSLAPDDPQARGRSKLLRDLALAAHFMPIYDGGFASGSILGSFCSAIPRVLPMSSVYLEVLHGTAPPAYIMSLINATVVAICCYTPQDVQNHHWMNDTTLPQMIKEETPDIHCLGFGIVRGIDIVKRLIYIVTPLSEEQLVSANTLLKGDIDIPTLLRDQVMTQRQSVETRSSGRNNQLNSSSNVSSADTPKQAINKRRRELLRLSELTGDAN